MSAYTPRPGDFGLTKISGLLGFLIGLGQFLNGDGSRFSHAFIVLGDGLVMQAEPGGASYGRISDFADRDTVFSRHVVLTDEQRKMIVNTAIGLEGTPYSFLDYLAIALHRFGIRLGFVERRVASSKHMICSQLVDYCYKAAGVHLFQDDRLPQDVTPGDLANCLVEEW